MAQIAQLKTVNGDWNAGVNADIIETLEEWLTDAKSGKFDAVGLVGIAKDGSVYTNITKHNQHPALVGAVAILLHKVMRVGDE